MDSARLMIPEERLIPSYLDMCREMWATGITYFTLDHPDQYDQWRHTILQRYTDYRAGVNLPEGYVPCTTLWLVEGDEVIGACHIRHRLTDKLRESGGHIGYGIKPSKWRKGYGELQLALALEQANRLGIDRVLITCENSNLGSARIIEKNGGVLEGVFDLVVDGVPGRKRRYWVETGELREVTGLRQRDFLRL